MAKECGFTSHCSQYSCLDAHNPNLQRYRQIQGVQLKSEPYFNMSNLFTKIYNMLYYTTRPASWSSGQSF